MNNSIDFFADDSTAIDNDIYSIESSLQIHLNNITLIAMLIATRQKLASLRKTSIHLFINGYELENVTEQMILGITITNDLKWNKNVDLIMLENFKWIIRTQKAENIHGHTNKKAFL